MKMKKVLVLSVLLIQSITIPKTVTSIGEKVFNRCDDLKEINVENENTTYSSVDGVLFDYDKTELIRYPGGKKVSNIYYTRYGDTNCRIRFWV